MIVEGRQFMSERKIDQVAEEIAVWMPSETDDFRELVLRVLASLPGGERLQEFVEPLLIGWKEVELLGRLLVSLQNRWDVELVVEKVLTGGGD
jgi:hypothetical protein